MNTTNLIVQRGKSSTGTYNPYFKLKELLGPYLYVINMAMTARFLRILFTKDFGKVFLYQQNQGQTAMRFPNSFSLIFIPEKYEKIHYIDVQKLKDIKEKFEEYYFYCQKYKFLPKKKNKWMEEGKWESVIEFMESVIKIKNEELKEGSMRRWM